MKLSSRTLSLLLGGALLLGCTACVAGGETDTDTTVGVTDGTTDAVTTDRPVDTEPDLPDFEGTPTVYRIYDIQRITFRNNREDYNDIVRFYSSLQGRLNKRARKTGVYVYQMYDSTDEFWFSYLREEGKLLEGCEIIDIRDFYMLWDTFGEAIHKAGIVLWDPDVPSTSNVAATICSVEGYLPVRYDTDEDSLYSWLTEKGVPVKMSLVDMFTGELGTKIADTDIDSTGSIKCDPYLWAMEKYLDRCHPSMLAYVLDGASQVASNPIYQQAESTTPNVNQLYSHDYYIYQGCFFLDLTCTRSEAPCDDPTQKRGTDYNTLATILGAVSDRNNGKMCKLMGFPPWYMKYTTYRNQGSPEPVELEWNFTSVLSSFNFVKEADAAHPAWMTNASVYCQYRSTVEKHENNEPPAPRTVEENVRYFTVYIGDYDSSAWLKEMVPTCFNQSSLGELPLMWAFNPNLSDRVPMIFDYVYEHKTTNDYFITGDSGAGYVMPSYIADLSVWQEFNRPYLEKFDMDIVGFILDKKPMKQREFQAYAEMGIKGACYNNYSEHLVVYGGTTPFIRMHDVYPGTEGWLEGMYAVMTGNGTNFASFRTIRLYTDQIVNAIREFEAYANAQNDGYTYKYVDMYTLFDLILKSGQGQKMG